MTAALLDHLWQSTLVAALAALLALSLRHNSARVRFWLWFAASLKFLIPFAALAALGERLAALLPVTVTASPRLLATLPVAALSWFLIEKRALALKSRFRRRAAVGPEAAPQGLGADRRAGN